MSTLPTQKSRPSCNLHASGDKVKLTDVCSEKFQFKDTFPRDNLLVRNEYGDPLRTMYLTNDIVKVRSILSSRLTR